MKKIIDFYKNGLLVRYDKDPGIPYYSGEDFPNLKREEFSFKNSANEEIKCFYYYYENYQKDKVILFLHGIGPGHTAYLREIETLASHGYKVLTLDYSGCGASEGERLMSVNAPTRDADELLKRLQLKEEIYVVGHSLGGYTALNILNLYPNIRVGVIISGFLSIYLEMKHFAKLPMFAKQMARYERGLLPEYGALNNEAFLFRTDKRVFFIHSVDDAVVRYKDSTKIVESLKNPHLKFKIVKGYKHNPNYSKEALTYMNTWMGEYQNKLNSGELDTDEKRREYFASCDIEKLTHQNEEIWAMIFDFLDKGDNI